MEKNTCDNCGKKHNANKSCPTADGCYLCPACQDEWKTSVFDQCQHQWRDGSHYDEDYLICDGCHGLVHKDDLAAA